MSNKTSARPVLPTRPGRGSRLHADLRLQTREPLGMARLNPEAPRSSHRTGVPLRPPTPGPGLRKG